MMVLQKVSATFLAACILQLLPVIYQINDVTRFLIDYNRKAVLYSRINTIRFWNATVGKTYGNESLLIKSRRRNWMAFKSHQAVLATDEMVYPKITLVQERLLDLIAKGTAYPRFRKLRWKLYLTLLPMLRALRLAHVNMSDGQVFHSSAAVNRFFAYSHDYDALAEAWKKWRDSIAWSRDTFVRRTHYLNDGAHQNGYKNYGLFDYYDPYRDFHFPSRMENLMSEIRPLYLELHAYARWKLSQRYPGRFNKSGLIPAHLLGNLWAQTWGKLFPLLRPYPDAGYTNVTGELTMHKWTALRMVKAVEKFYTSLGFPPMTKKFWERSVFVKPANRTHFDCRGVAKNFYSPGDFRIKMCISPNLKFLKAITVKMGHIQYFMAVKNLTYSFRKGANPALFDAVGLTLSLSMLNPRHLHRMGLIVKAATDEKMELNNLMRSGLMKIALLPYAFTVDSWRWSIYNGTFPPQHWNAAWWKLRNTLQGLEAPMKRTEKDLDPLAKYHVAMNMPFIRFFLNTLVQFQFFEKMCNASGHTGPIHQCDFYGSKKAGQMLRKMMAIGRRLPWQKAMQVMTGQYHFKADSFLRYYAPLNVWLKKKRKEAGYSLGW